MMRCSIFSIFDNPEAQLWQGHMTPPSLKRLGGIIIIFIGCPRTLRRAHEGTSIWQMCGIDCSAAWSFLHRWVARVLRHMGGHSSAWWVGNASHAFAIAHPRAVNKREPSLKGHEASVDVLQYRYLPFGSPDPATLMPITF